MKTSQTVGQSFKTVNESVTANHFSSEYDSYSKGLELAEARKAIEKKDLENKAQEDDKQFLIDFISSKICPNNYLFIKSVIDHAVWAILQDSADCFDLFDSSGLTDEVMIETARNFFIADRKQFITHLNVSEDFVAFRDPALQNAITH